MSSSNRASVSEVVTLNSVMRELKAIEEHVQKIDGLFSEQTKLSQTVAKVNDRLDNVCDEIGKMNAKITDMEGVQDEHRRLFAKRGSNKCANMTKGSGHHGDGTNKEDEVGFIDPSANKRSLCARMCGSLAGLGHFIYNPKTRLIMGRNCKEWGQLILFYVIFYACLIGYWIACLSGFLATTNVSVPTLTGFQSMLQLNPAMGYRPQPDFETNLIKFNMSDPSTYQAFLDDANSFLDAYTKDQSNLLDCSAPDVSANATAACRFLLSDYKDCLPESGKPYQLGFNTGKPCIILKMNRIYGWLPSTKANTTNQYNDVKVRCKGENEADGETLGQLQYYPGGSDSLGTYGLIKASYFPYMQQPNYLSPLVFVQFPQIKKYTVSLIWCQFDSDGMNFAPGVYWASPMPTERAGGVHFELVVDSSSGTAAASVPAAAANVPAAAANVPTTPAAAISSKAPAVTVQATATTKGAAPAGK